MCTGVVVSEHFPGQTLQSRSLHLQKRPNRQDHSTKIASSGIFTSPLLLPHLPVASFLPHLPSSLRLHAFSKMQKTLGPFAQKVLRPPAGAPRHGMCVFTHACQQKYASGLKNPGLFRGPGKLFRALPRGLRNGSPGPGPPRRLQEPSTTANVRFL